MSAPKSKVSWSELLHHFHKWEIWDDNTKDKKLVVLRRALEIIPTGAVVAGGSLCDFLASGEFEGDIDIFVPMDKLWQTVDKIRDDRMLMLFGYYRLRDPAETYYEWRTVSFASHKRGLPKIQVIGHDLGAPQALVAGFDLTCAQVATDGQNAWLGPDTKEDIWFGRFGVNKYEPGRLAVRVRKYLNKEWEPKDNVVDYLLKELGA